MSQTISIRLPEELLKTLNKLCHQRERTKTYLIRKALESYLLEHQDCQEAAYRFKDPHDKILTSTELKKSLGL